MEEVEVLGKLLAEEARVAAELAEALVAEQRATIELDAAALLAAAARKAALQEELARRAAARQAAARRLAVVVGARRERVTDLLPRLPQGSREPLRRRSRELKRALLEARTLQRQNAALLAGSLEFVGSLLEEFGTARRLGRYDARATVVGGAATDLVDRRV